MRPRATGTKRICVSISKDLIEAYSQTAERLGISLSRLIERALFSFARDYLWASKEDPEEREEA